METIKITSCAALICGAVLLMSSCVKDDVYRTPHPTQGALLVTTDWSDRSSESVQPVSYLLRVSGRSGMSDEQSVKGNTNLYHALLEPESYELLVYNVPESITVSGDIATVTAAGRNGIEALPGYLFSAVQALDMAKDDTLSVMVKMRQRIRQLTLVLKLKEGDHNHITAVNATLSGIASGINLRTGALVSTSDTFLSPVFMKTEASVQTIETDLTEVLHEHFDDGSMTPLILGANFDLPSQADFSGEISNWSPVDGGQVDIH